MSGFLKQVGKVFKKIVKSPIFKAVLIGAAIYFTGGLAIGALGGAVLPGVGALASGLGITAGSFGAAAAGAVGIAAEGAAAAGMAALGEEAAAVTAGLAGTGSGFGAAAAGAASEAVGISGAALGTSAGAIGPSAATSGGGILSSLTQGAKDFMGSTFGQKMVGEVISQGGKAVLGAMQSNKEDERYQQNREDIIRRGYVPDLTSSYAKPAEPARPGNIGNQDFSSLTPNTGGAGSGGAGSYRPGYRQPGIVQQALSEEPMARKPYGA